ncbi:hypothetical protein KAI78_03385 [bacterium]|nr:hypothetical protein [bacterium]
MKHIIFSIFFISLFLFFGCNSPLFSQDNISGAGKILIGSSPVSSVIVDIVTDKLLSVITNSKGEYRLPRSLKGKKCYIVPSKTGYSFTPEKAEYTEGTLPVFSAQPSATPPESKIEFVIEDSSLKISAQKNTCIILFNQDGKLLHHESDATPDNGVISIPDFKKYLKSTPAIYYYILCDKVNGETGRVVF